VCQLFTLDRLSITNPFAFSSPTFSSAAISSLAFSAPRPMHAYRRGIKRCCDPSVRLSVRRSVCPMPIVIPVVFCTSTILKRPLLPVICSIVSQGVRRRNVICTANLHYICIDSCSRGRLVLTADWHRSMSQHPRAQSINNPYRREISRNIEDIAIVRRDVLTRALHGTTPFPNKKAVLSQRRPRNAPTKVNKQ